MIIPPCIFLILAILPTITKQQQSPNDDGPSGQVRPTWTDDCDTQIACICQLVSTENKLNQIFKPKSADCVTGTQTRYFSEDIALFQFQVTEDQSVLGKKLMIHKEKQEVFGCEIDNKSGKVVLTAPAGFIKDFDLALFEDRSRFEKGFTLCAVKSGRAPQLVKFMEEDLTYKAIMKQSMTLTTSKQVSKEYEFERTIISDFFHNRKNYKCNPYSFKDQLYSSDYHALPIRKRDGDILNCKNYGDSYDIRYERDENEIKDKAAEEVEKNKPIKELKCAREEKDSLLNFALIYYIVYEPVDGQPPSVDKQLTDAETYSFYCAAKHEELCQHPTVGCTSPHVCPVYNPGKKGQPATLTCTGKKWQLGAEQFALSADAKCQKNPTSALNEPAFFLTLPSGDEIEVKKDTRCFTDYDCYTKSPISIPKLAENTNDLIRCKAQGDELTFTDHVEDVTLTAGNLTCDKTSGSWKSAISGELIPGGVQLKCPEEEVKEKFAAAELSQPLIYGAIFGSLLGLLTVLGVSAFVAYYLLTHRKHKNIDDGSFKKMNKADQLAYCREFFPKVITASTTSIYHIVNGLKAVDMLLNLEIEDPEIWEVVYPFLMRIHGTIRRIDHRCWHMFTRYCFLRAKMIIDKHGWISATPIRKSAQTGTIRVVAIQLLALTLYNNLETGAAKLIIAGFRKLLFAGAEQYPHCGAMWFLIMNTNVGRIKQNANATTTRDFDWANFAKTMLDIALNATLAIPDEEVIPAFGSVAQQAAFALGSWTNLGQVLDMTAPITQGDQTNAKIALSYVRGIAYSTYRSPAQVYLMAFEMFHSAKPEVLADIYKVTPESDWNKVMEETLKVAVFYGRHLDAKRLEQRFMPSVQQPSALLTQLIMDQKEFELATQEHIEEQREWYAEHTDKPELKAKPVYAMTAKFKEDNRKAVVNENVTAGDNNSGGAGGGNSAKDAKSEPRSINAGGPKSDNTDNSASCSDIMPFRNADLKSGGKGSSSSNSKDKAAAPAVAAPPTPASSNPPPV